MTNEGFEEHEHTIQLEKELADEAGLSPYTDEAFLSDLNPEEVAPFDGDKQKEYDEAINFFFSSQYGRGHLERFREFLSSVNEGELPIRKKHSVAVSTINYSYDPGPLDDFPKDDEEDNTNFPNNSGATGQNISIVDADNRDFTNFPEFASKEMSHPDFLKIPIRINVAVRIVPTASVDLSSKVVTAKNVSKFRFDAVNKLLSKEFATGVRISKGRAKIPSYDWRRYKKLMKLKDPLQIALGVNVRIDKPYMRNSHNSHGNGHRLPEARPNATQIRNSSPAKTA